MLNKYRNGFLELITKNGFMPSDFDASEIDDSKFCLTLSNTPLMFVTHEIPNDFHRFVCWYTEFKPQFPLSGVNPGDGSIDISEVYDTFISWLKTVVLEYFKEQEYPDLWQQLRAQEHLLTGKEITEGELLSFSSEEKAQIRISIETFELSIVEEFNPSESEIAVIENRLKYLSESLDRLNKVDWKGIAISSVMSISIALSLDTEKGKVLFNLLKQAFSGILKLIQ